MKNASYNFVKVTLDMSNWDIKSCQRSDKKCEHCEEQRQIVKLCKAWIKAYVLHWEQHEEDLVVLVSDDRKCVMEMKVRTDTTQPRLKKNYAHFDFEVSKFDSKEKAKRWVESKAEKLGFVIKKS